MIEKKRLEALRQTRRQLDRRNSRGNSNTNNKPMSRPCPPCSWAPCPPPAALCPVSARVDWCLQSDVAAVACLVFSPDPPRVPATRPCLQPHPASPPALARAGQCGAGGKVGSAGTATWALLLTVFRLDMKSMPPDADEFHLFIYWCIGRVGGLLLFIYLLVRPGGLLCSELIACMSPGTPPRFMALQAQSLERERSLLAKVPPSRPPRAALAPLTAGCCARSFHWNL